MKEKLLFIDGLYKEILQVSISLRNKLTTIKTTNSNDIILKLNLTVALLHGMAWIMALKAVRNNEKIHMSEYVNLPEIDFNIKDENNKELLAAKLVVENLYTRILRLNNNLIESLNNEYKNFNRNSDI